ncbi:MULTISPECIES: N-6 DNA methylase [Roseivirga]|uniref:DNA methylase adenine-specific domain-containing protein n=1 Tax=Roseivirga spongicola TaxID=333140 RepID=A0A150XB80_9BACT|nr:MULTISPECIES: N-6 DNA methylase [Roseivirga]KYG75924.1 hypothetical protein AWW68_08835 [Roseivirga spongicola]MBO6495583.1 N-6 DNA methylase [Roseivirga sp.]WPZ10505.1 N-6 DNA methylase [Roseivirga spongicola]
MKNLFCNSTDLKNEADVEALFVERLLNYFSFPDDRVKRKRSLDEMVIGQGSKKEKYKPDYVLFDSAGDPIIVIDAKAPSEKIEDYQYQVSSYALGLNQKFKDKNPVIFTVLTNGLYLIVYPWDNSQPEHFLKFEDFAPHNESFIELRSKLSYSAFEHAKATKGVFEHDRPTLHTLLKAFNDCHDLIWKKEKISPTDAFYEFSKIMFIKIREDNKIHDKFSNGDSLTKDDFVFSTHWLDAMAKNGIEHPFDKILFSQVQEDLEEQIKRNKKKRVFEKDEGLNLKASTVYEVVKKLQNFDLYGIDEDLNGRMFETFLNATVRGKGLGQFFTPRGVVHYMVESTPLTINVSKGKSLEESIPYVFDGCCGSGGFLIDAMAQFVRDINNKTNLTDKQKEAYLEEAKNNHLYGIDANPKISRIARLNMYLHGDGGSKIFKADALDKLIQSEAGISKEEEQGLKELRDEFNKNHLKFDVILSNPPFSMKYDSKDPNEKVVLEQYSKVNRVGTKMTNSEKSNVLFLERYFDLLKPGTGELSTVIDDTVINGQKSQRYRDFLLDNFILVQVISLPFNTFFGAEANVKTSIVHLRRKSEGEKQGHVFMAIANNVGHDDHKKPTPDRNNLREIIRYYERWQNGEDIDDVIIDNQSNDEPLGCPMQIFTVAPNKLNKERLDAFYYAPELVKAREKLFELRDTGEIDLFYGRDFEVIPEIKKRQEKNFGGNSYKYFEIGDVTIDGTIVKYREEPFESLPTRARLQVRKDDVIFAKNNSSRGTTVIIPSEFDGQLVTTGFIGLRPKSQDEKYLLWGILESEFFRKQIYYLSITASQPEVRETIFKNEIIIPIPKDKKAKQNIIDSAVQAEKARISLSNAVKGSSDAVNRIFSV